MPQQRASPGSRMASLTVPAGVPASGGNPWQEARVLSWYLEEDRQRSEPLPAAIHPLDVVQR